MQISIASKRKSIFDQSIEHDAQTSRSPDCTAYLNASKNQSRNVIAARKIKVWYAITPEHARTNTHSHTQTHTQAIEEPQKRCVQNK